MLGGFRSKDLPAYDAVNKEAWFPLEIPNALRLAMAMLFCFDWASTFVKLCDLFYYHAQSSDKENYTQSPDDCVMLVKRYVSSTKLSQMPLVFLPACWRTRLTQGLEVNPRNLMTERARKEHLVTTYPLTAQGFPFS